jgi:hypothetical protein
MKTKPSETHCCNVASVFKYISFGDWRKQNANHTKYQLEFVPSEKNNTHFSQAKHHSMCHKFIPHFAAEGFVRNITEKMCLWRSKSAMKRMNFSCVKSLTEQLILNLPCKMTSRIKWRYKRPSNYFGLWVEGWSEVYLLISWH